MTKVHISELEALADKYWNTLDEGQQSGLKIQAFMERNNISPDDISTVPREEKNNE